MQKELTIIYPPIANWHLLFQRPQQLLTAFSKICGVRSIFITLELYKKLDRPIIELNENLYLVRDGVDYDYLIKGKKILWFSYPPLIHYAEGRNFDFIVFDAIDNPVEEFSHWKNEMEAAVNRSNIISCSAELLYEIHKGCGKPVFLCPNGADYEHFSQAQRKTARPIDFPDFNKEEKVIGFYGSLASWLDTNLIKKIAEKYKVVLIGKTQFSNFHLYNKNITILEHKDYNELPAYLSRFDLALIPFKLTNMTKGCDPIKVYEYLSAGKPILATRLRELEKFKQDIYFIDMNNCYEIIEKAIKEENDIKKNSRINTAKDNSWNERAKLAYNMIIKNF